MEEEERNKMSGNKKKSVSTPPAAGRVRTLGPPSLEDKGGSKLAVSVRVQSQISFTMLAVPSVHLNPDVIKRFPWGIIPAPCNVNPRMEYFVAKPRPEEAQERGQRGGKKPSSPQGRSQRLKEKEEEAKETRTSAVFDPRALAVRTSKQVKEKAFAAKGHYWRGEEAAKKPPPSDAPGFASQVPAPWKSAGGGQECQVKFSRPQPLSRPRPSP